MDFPSNQTPRGRRQEMLIRPLNLNLSVILFTMTVTVPGVAQSAIQWTKNTVVVDGNTAQNALTSVSHDGHVLVFNTSDSRITGLAAGQILLLEDLGARRVLGTVRQGPVTAVATNAAALVDFIQDGTIQFPNKSHDPMILDQQDTDFGPGVDRLSGEVDDWKYESSAAGGNDPNDLSFYFKGEKHLGGLDARSREKDSSETQGFHSWQTSMARSFKSSTSLRRLKVI